MSIFKKFVKVTLTKPGLLMLIDFEKAFDSISWKFMCNVLEFLGLPSDYKN